MLFVFLSVGGYWLFGWATTRGVNLGVRAAHRSLLLLLDAAAWIDTRAVLKLLLFSAVCIVPSTALVYSAMWTAVDWFLFAIALAVSFSVFVFVRVVVEAEAFVSLRTFMETAAAAVLALALLGAPLVVMLGDVGTRAASVLLAIPLAMGLAGIHALHRKISYRARAMTLREQPEGPVPPYVHQLSRWVIHRVESGHPVRSAFGMAAIALMAPFSRVDADYRKRLDSMFARLLLRLRMDKFALRFCETRLAGPKKRSAVLASCQATAHFRLGEPSLALGLLESFPGSNAYVSLQKAELLWHQGELAKAFELNELAAQADQGCPVARMNRALFRIELDLWDRVRENPLQPPSVPDSVLTEAAEDIDAATQLSIKRLGYLSAEVLYARGVIESLRGDRIAAKKLFVSALMMEDYAPARLALASLSAVGSRFFVAPRYHLKKVLASNPHRSDRYHRASLSLLNAIGQAFDQRLSFEAPLFNLCLLDRELDVVDWTAPRPWLAHHWAEKLPLHDPIPWEDYLAESARNFLAFIGVAARNR